MLGVGIMLGLQDGRLDLAQDASINITTYPDGGPVLTWHGNLSTALDYMIWLSDNSATAACMNALHKANILPYELMAVFRSLGLPTLILNGTQPGGYWGTLYLYPLL